MSEDEEDVKLAEEAKAKALEICDTLAETLFYKLLETVPCSHCRAGVVSLLLANLCKAADDVPEGIPVLDLMLGMVGATTTRIYDEIDEGDEGDDDGGPAVVAPTAAKDQTATAATPAKLH